MEKWEYRTEIVNAHIENKDVKEYFGKKYPNWKKPPKCTPETMEQYLNTLGENGWEVVQMQPVQLSDENSVVMPTNHYTNTYFCVFKRRKQE